MSTITLIKLSEIVVNRPAPKPDGKNLWIDIDINLSKSTALIHSQQEESVGTHKQRTVTFRADHDCSLRFSNPAVFNRGSISLIAYRQTALEVRDEIRQVETSYEVYVGTEIEGGAELVSGVAAMGGPHIVVP
ncbi:MAG: hypothetical protein LAP86_01385 [Acidobacteriia bacterium]|nr:hypothetical protein [Terriglobia bacterium]